MWFGLALFLLLVFPARCPLSIQLSAVSTDIVGLCSWIISHISFSVSSQLCYHPFTPLNTSVALIFLLIWSSNSAFKALISLLFTFPVLVVFSTACVSSFSCSSCLVYLISSCLARLSASNATVLFSSTVVVKS